jgi:FkbM family methyltransferase
MLNQIKNVLNKTFIKKFIKGLNDKNSLLTNFYKILKKYHFNPKCIYDIGAHKGTWTLECMKHFPNAEYILFEPQLNLKTEIEKNLKGKNNYTLYSYGVGNNDGHLLFTYHDRADSCSFNISENEAIQKGYKQIKTPIIKLDNFVELNKLQRPDILKIDAEGIDLEVLSGAHNLLIENVEIVLVEVGILNYHFKNSAINVLNYMEKINFKLFDITDLNRPFGNGALWLCEFVFIKKDGKLDKDYSII